MYEKFTFFLSQWNACIQGTSHSHTHSHMWSSQWNNVVGWFYAFWQMNWKVSCFLYEVSFSVKRADIFCPWKLKKKLFNSPVRSSNVEKSGVIFEDYTETWYEQFKYRSQNRLYTFLTLIRLSAINWVWTGKEKSLLVNLHANVST